MEPVDIRFDRPLRDPMGDAQRYEDFYGSLLAQLNEPDLDQDAVFIAEKVIRRGACLYAVGVPLAELAHRVSDDQLFLNRHSSQIALRINDFDDLRYLSLALLLLPTHAEVEALAALVDQSSATASRLYGPDLLMKAFNPDWKLARKYPRTTQWTPPTWTDTLVRALAAPPEARSAELGRHMTRWCRLMKPFGWKPVRDFSPEAAEKRGALESVFVDFAFEAALAVCAYDIDDSGFRDHPYYPRDLVAHYRAHIRHTRDAWRGEGVGAGVPVQAPPSPQRADLAKSKRKGLPRWLELASDGDADAVEAVLEAQGNPRKISDVDALGCAMAEQGIGVHADIKDDDTLLSLLGGLAQARGLGEFQAPASPAGIATAGPGRCEFLLRAAATWLQPQGYRLLELEVDDDVWCAAMVRADYLDEWRGLGERLGIGSSEFKQS